MYILIENHSISSLSISSSRPTDSILSIIKPGVAAWERLTRTTRRAHCPILKILDCMKAFWACTDLEDTTGTLADHAVFKEHQTKKEHPICSCRTENVRQSTARDAIPCTCASIEDAMTALVTPERQNGMLRSRYLLEEMLQAFFSKATDVKRKSDSFASLLLCRIEDVTSSPRLLTWMSDTRMPNQDLIPPVETIEKKEAEKFVDVSSKRDNCAEDFSKWPTLQ